MADFAKLQKTADRLITANGRAVTLRKRDRGTADPATPWRGPSIPGTDITVMAIAVILDFDEDTIDGTLIRRNDKRALVAELDVNPAGASVIHEIETFNTLVDGADTWHIERIKLLQPSTEKLFYDLQLRK